MRRKRTRLITDQGLFQVFGALIEYACVGYTDKRIQLRKNRFLAMQKMMEEKRLEVYNLLGRTLTCCQICSKDQIPNPPQNKNYNND